MKQQHQTNKQTTTVVFIPVNFWILTKTVEHLPTFQYFSWKKDYEDPVIPYKCIPRILLSHWKSWSRTMCLGALWMCVYVCVCERAHVWLCAGGIIHVHMWRPTLGVFLKCLPPYSLSQGLWVELRAWNLTKELAVTPPSLFFERYTQRWTSDAHRAFTCIPGIWTQGFQFVQQVF